MDQAATKVIGEFQIIFNDCESRGKLVTFLYSTLTTVMYI